MRRMVSNLIITLAVLWPVASQAANMEDIVADASVTTQTHGLSRKPLYPIHVPPGRSVVAISGYVETSANTSRFSEALISLHMSNTDRCPVQGQDVGAYQAINAHFPNTTLIALIIKQTALGKQKIPVNFQWNTTIPLPACLFLILDGTDFAGRPYSMTTHLTIRTVPTRRETFHQVELIGMLADEFLMSPQKHETAYKVFHIPKEMTLRALFGNVAAVAGSGAVRQVPFSTWSAVHSVFVQRGGCPQFPHNGMYTDNPTLDRFRTLPQTQTLQSVRLVGRGTSYPNAPFVFQPDTLMPLHYGDCIIHGVQADGLPGSPGFPVDAINTESQINMQVTIP